MNKTFKNSKILLCLATMFAVTLNVLFSTSSFAQTEMRTVTGIVSDEVGPIAGAAAVVSGANNGAITDVDGRFTLSGVTLNDVIQISCLGYETQEIVYSGQETLNVTLATESEFLEGVALFRNSVKYLHSPTINGYSIKFFFKLDIEFLEEFLKICHT